MTAALATGGAGRGGSGHAAVMTDGDDQHSDDAHRLEETARTAGWWVARDPTRMTVHMAQGPWRLHLTFDLHGDLRDATLTGPGRGHFALDRLEVEALLERGAQPRRSRNRPTSR